MEINASVKNGSAAADCGGENGAKGPWRNWGASVAGGPSTRAFRLFWVARKAVATRCFATAVHDAGAMFLGGGPMLPV
jgi:hypothetical protein